MIASATTTTADQLRDFASILYEPDDIVEIRRIRRREIKPTFHPSADLPSLAASLTRDNQAGRNIYIGVNPRLRHAGKAEDVALSRVLFADLDHCTFDEAMQRLAESGLPVPTLIIASGHGVHFYWRLAEPIEDLSVWTGYQKQLIKLLNSDRKIHDPPRIMRLPGFLNVKEEPYCPCHVVECDATRRYEWFNILPPASASNGSSLSADQITNNGHKPAPEPIADALTPGNRHGALVSLAGTMRRRNMGREAILAALLEENRNKCKPPKEKAEVEKIVDSVMQYPTAETASNADPFAFPLTDAGNGERIMDRHGDKLVFVALWDKPIVYSNGSWNIDETGVADQLALETMRHLKAMGARLSESDDDAKHTIGMRLLKHAHNCESHRRLKDMLIRASKVNGASIMPDDLDRDPWKLNVKNGTIDLKSGELTPHRREDFITKLCPVRFNASAQCPTFQAFLETIFEGNQDLISFIRRAIGYTLTGIASERVLFILLGGGSNGKSTLLGVFRDLLGTYSTQTAADTLMAKRHEGIPNDIARLKGARFVSATESDDGKCLAEGLVKRMTGGEDKLTARFMRAEYFDFVPTFKLWLGTNHKPIIRGNEPAIWDRILLVPFNKRFEKPDQDKTLPEKLRAELPGILNWALAGCLEWQRSGLGTPAVVTEAVQNYRAEMDTLADFIAAECVTGDKCEAGATALYDLYKISCQLNKEDAMSQTKFGRQLQDRGFISGKDSAGRIVRKGIGIRKKNTTPPEGSDTPPLNS